MRDLMLAGRVRAAARRHDVTFVRDVAALAGIAGDRLLVDLDQPGAIEAAAAWRGRTGGEVLGVVQHVHAEAIAAARAAGIGDVVSRGGFGGRLGRLFPPA